MLRTVASIFATERVILYVLAIRTQPIVSRKPAILHQPRQRTQPQQRQALQARHENHPIQERLHRRNQRRQSLPVRKVIVSVPTPLYPLIEFQPLLPRAKQTLSESTELGYYSKTLLVFRSPWWRAANLSGVFSSLEGPISFTRDTCAEEDGQCSITYFHAGTPGRRWSALSAAARREAVLAQFRAAFGSVVGTVPEPINAIEKEWTKDVWARDAPSPVMGPGVMTGEAGRSIREPFEDVHFIGTETSLA